MKLLQRYSRINLATSIAIFLLASIAFYFSLHYVLLKQVDEDLKTEKHEIETFVTRYNKLPEIIPLADEITVYTEVPQLSKNLQIESIKIAAEEDEVFRQITFSLPVAGKIFEVSVAKSMENTEAITKSVLIISTISVFIFILAGFIINRIVLKRLWMPFYKSMHIMKEYKIGRNATPVFPQTGIAEFATLNETLDTSIKNSEKDYRNLKEFTENASHELQTPVAVVRSKLDVLIQDEHLSESQSNLVQGAYDALQKLARINKALLLLAKIENSQYSDKSAVALHTQVEEKLLYFHEVLQNRSIHLTTELEPVVVTMNQSLAEILLNNLISNCIKHSATGGSVHISLMPQRLSVSNGTFQDPLDPAIIFKRFYKGNSSNEAHGLGLAIVAEICTVSDFKINYSFSDHQHSFIVSFTA